MADRSALVIVTGTSGTLRIPEYLVALRPVLGAGFRCLMTHSATRFLPAESLGWFSCEVISPQTPGVNPVELALSAMGIIVLPASAHMLAVAALGIASSPAATALLAASSGCLFFPHMNPVMWHKDVTRQHVASLRSQGHMVVDPEPSKVYEMWRGELGTGLTMPGPESAARIVAGWLGKAGDAAGGHAADA